MKRLVSLGIASLLVFCAGQGCEKKPKAPDQRLKESIKELEKESEELKKRDPFEQLHKEREERLKEYEKDLKQQRRRISDRTIAANLVPGARSQVRRPRSAAVFG